MNRPYLFNSMRSHKLFDRYETYLALLLTAWIIVLDVTVLMNAGALWRDEINGVNIAAMPSFSETWDMAKHDSFRMVWTFLLRGWIITGAGSTDFGLRILGFLIGLGILGALWFSARTLYRGVPLISLALLGLCPTVFIYANSLRTYGCSMILVVLSIVMIWKVLEIPSMKRILIAGLVAILSAQCAFFNCVLLFSTCVAGCIVGIMNQSKKSVLFIIGIGAIGAFSLFPYASDIFHGYQDLAIKPVNADFLFILGRFDSAIISTKDFLQHVWVVLFVITITVCSFEIFKTQRAQIKAQQNFSTFILLQLILGTICYAVFLKRISSSIPILPWHYLPVLILMTLCFDAGLQQSFNKSPIMRMARMAFVLFIVATVSGSAWNLAHVKMTNVDEIAAKISAQASPKDLVVVEPFWYGISFMRYYHGSTPWITVPDMDDHSVHRWDLARMAVQAPEPLKSEFEKISNTLKSGNKVWLVSDFSFLARLKSAASYSRDVGHKENILLPLETADFILLNAKTIKMIPMEKDEPVNKFEKNTVFLIGGWK